MQTIYERLSHEGADTFLDQYEKGASIEQLAQQLGLPPKAVRHTVGCAYFDEGRIDEAEAMVRKGLDDEPDSETHNVLLRCLLASPRDTKQDFYDESVHWARLYEDPARITKPQAFSNRRDPDKVLRFGFLCDYLGNTLFGTLSVLPLFKLLRAHGVEAYLYNFGPANPECHDAATRCRDIADLSLDGLYDAIRRDEIDLLFDLNGRLRVSNRYPVILRKPAPIQVNYFNLPATTGLQSVDYLITDAPAVPKSDDPFYTERLYRLPGGANGAFMMPGSCNGTFMPEGHVPVGSLPFDRNGFITFGSFNATFKLNDRTLEAWAEILNRVEGSRMFIKNEHLIRPRIQRRIQTFFAKHGIGGDRLILERRSPVWHMWQCYGEVDLALDTFPYSGGSTTLHALWQGVPVLTVRGCDWRGRITTTMETSAGLEQFIADDPADYVEMAVRYAAEIERLRETRLGMRERLKSAQYFNLDGVTGEFVDACRQMWRTWLASEAQTPTRMAKHSGVRSEPSAVAP